MQQNLSFKVLPSEASNELIIKQLIATTIGKEVEKVTGYIILRQSIDARAKNIWVNLTVNAFIDEPFHLRKLASFNFRNVYEAKKKVVIIGAGPAGLLAALTLIEAGIKPIILERGKDVRARRRDLAQLNKHGIIDEESNYCFGEGGAGTYSDGKLYTRSNKRGSIDRVLNLFVHFGAEQNILYEAHPHIGTNKLPQIITAIRKLITGHGGEFIFEKKVIDLIIQNDHISKVKTADGDEFEANAFILATGHSARDIFILLHEKKLTLQAKPFALGVRVEHPQIIIDQIQYHCITRDNNLPPASYGLVQQVDGKGVFSFCMCPGGIIAPASTAVEELVVNGWSPSKRNNPFANSGLVVQVEIEDAIDILKKNGIPLDDTPLLMMKFQEMIEHKAFAAGGGKFVAPAQRMVDFTANKISSSLPLCSYIPGLASADLREVLPAFISDRLSIALKKFGKKMKGYLTNEAVLVATESRTSSPVRIPRNSDTLSHPQLFNLYPCGEGAGYAGGIVSAAMDGEKVAKMIVNTFR